MLSPIEVTDDARERLSVPFLERYHGVRVRALPSDSSE